MLLNLLKNNILMTPNYKAIYVDIIKKKFPHKKEGCLSILEKKNLSAIDVIALNTKIFGKSDRITEKFNQEHRFYYKSDIIQILEFQKKNKLNNNQLANHFKISRNTIAKWRKKLEV